MLEGRIISEENLLLVKPNSITNAILGNIVINKIIFWDNLMCIIYLQMIKKSGEAK